MKNMHRRVFFLTYLVSILVGCSYFGDKEAGVVYNSPQDLSTARVVVAIGTTHDNYMAKNFPKAKIVHVEVPPETLMALESGKADFGLIDYMQAKSVLEQKPYLKIVDEHLFEDGIGIGFRKDDSELCGRFNTFLKEIRKNGEYDEICRRWIDNPEGSELPTFNIPKKGKKLIIGTNSGSFPFVFIKHNKIIGFDIELLNRFAEREKLNIEYLDMSFGGLISALASKKIDVIAASMCITEERSKQVLFSDSYFEAVSVVVAADRSAKAPVSESVAKGFPVVVPSDPEKGATDIDTLKAIVGKKKVSAVEGTTQEFLVSAQFPADQVVVVKENPDALLMVKSNNVSYTCCNWGNAKSYLMKDSTLEVVFSGFIRSDCCFGIKKENPKLLEELNGFLSSLRESGELEEIPKKWFTMDDANEIPAFDFSKADKVLRVGSGCMSIPYTYIGNGKKKGIDLDILTRFAHATGRRIEITELPFGSLIASLISNKVDIIANTFSPTEERRKSINFSDPYYVSYSVIIGKKENKVAVSQSDKGWFETLSDSFRNNLMVEKRYMLILNGLKETLLISILSLIFGTIFGAAVCYLRMHRSPLLVAIGKAYIDIMRGLPVLVLLMITYYIIFADSPLSATSVAIFTFALNFGAYVSEMFRSAISSIDRGQNEAGVAMGFTSVQTFIYIIAPQAIARVLPIYKGEAISLVKMTSIVGYIAVQDLTKASDIVRSRTFDAFFPLLVVAAIYFALAWAFTLLLDLITSKIVTKK